MRSILFVCHGNICRSPMGEFILKKMVADRGIGSEYHIESAATSREEIGNGIYPPAKAMLSSKGIPFDKTKTARQITAGDYQKFDLIVAMDRYNVSNILRIVGSDPLGKVVRLLDLTNRPGDVADPWYTGDFLQTYIDITEGCEALLGSEALAK